MVKRISRCLVIILLFVSTVSCGNRTLDTNSDKINTPKASEAPKREVRNIGVDTYGENTQYVRTGDPEKDFDEYPYVIVIDSVEEFKKYREKYFSGNIGTWINKERGLTHFNEEYFKSRILIVVARYEPSGSIRHNVTNVCLKSEGYLDIKMEIIKPAVQTDDCAWWHILIEPAEGVYVEDDSQVHVTYTDVKNYNEEDWYDELSN